MRRQRLTERSCLLTRAWSGLQGLRFGIFRTREVRICPRRGLVTSSTSRKVSVCSICALRLSLLCCSDLDFGNRLGFGSRLGFGNRLGFGSRLGFGIYLGFLGWLR